MIIYRYIHIHKYICVRRHTYVHRYIDTYIPTYLPPSLPCPTLPYLHSSTDPSMHPCMHILCRHVYICMCVYYIVRPLRSHTGSCVLLRKAACRLFSPQGNKSGWHWVWRKVSKRLQQRSACRCVGCTKLCKDGPWPSFPKRKSVHARFYGSALARNALPPTVPNWPS